MRWAPLCPAGPARLGPPPLPPPERKSPRPAPDPDEVVHDLDPGLVGVGEDRPDLARGGVADEDAERVLQAVEMLEHDPPGIPGPLETGDVGVGRVARRPQPNGISAGRGDDANLDGGAPLARLGGVEARDLGG